MTPTMPPAVQPRIPAPAVQADLTRASRSASEPPEGDGFRNELVRRRKDNSRAQAPAEPEPKATRPGKKAATAKSTKAKRATAAADEQAAAVGAPAAAPETPEGEAVETHEAVGEVVPSEGPAEAETTSAPDATAGARVQATAPTPLRRVAADDADAETEPEETSAQVPPAVAALDVTEADLSTVQSTGGGADPDLLLEDVAAQDAPPPIQSRPARPVHPVESNGGATDHDNADGDAAEGSADPQAWMRRWDTALETAAVASPVEEVPPEAPHAGRPGVVEAPAPAALDVSVRHAGPSHAATAPFAAAAKDAMPAEDRFAANNHDNIVKGMRAEVLPNGGTMRIRLDPPQLGALQVTVQMQDGLVTASFETSSDEATRLLGHSLNQLKSVLESHGVAVDKLQVQQAPREERTGSARDEPSQQRGQNHPNEQEHAARQEQQRREMLRRMWRRLSGLADPLDVTG